MFVPLPETKYINTRVLVRGLGLFFSVLIVALGAVEAQAAAWYPIVVSNNVMIFLDKSTLQKKGSISKIWQWQFFSPPIGRVDSAKTYVAFDCQAKKRNTEYIIGINGPTNIIQEGVPESQFEAVTKGTIEATVMEAVCDNKFQGTPQQDLDLNQVRNFMFGVGK